MSEQVWSVITMTPRGIGPEDLGQERHVRQCRILARAKSRAAFARKLIASGIEYRSEAAVGAWLRDFGGPTGNADDLAAVADDDIYVASLDRPRRYLRVPEANR